MLNHIVLMGRLTADPELRRTGSGVAVASCTIAVEDDYKGQDGEKKTIFVNIVAWRNTAEFISKYFSKGRMIAVSGRLDIREWTDKDGNKRKTAEVIAENAYFGDSKKDSDAPAQGGDTYGGNYGKRGGYGGNSYGQQSGGFGGYSQPSTAPASDFAMLEDDDVQLPF